MNEKDYLIWLNSINGIGNTTIEKLLWYFGSFEALWNAPISDINSVPNIRKKALDKLIETRNIEYVKKYKEKITSKKVNCIDKNDDLYPDVLKDIPDPPHLLYERGRIIKEDKNAIAIIGSRKCTSYGKNIAYKFAKELASYGITVVSGMAYGIDSAAHRGALDGGGRTIAVLGCSVDICYPKSNANLMRDIIENGAVISEYPLGTNPTPGNFPRRNRIISGLSKGVLVVEAGLKSGTLITVDFALEQGKDVFSIPGNINCSVSQGTNKLIKEGAKPVTCVEDILEEFNIQKQMKEKDNMHLDLSDTERDVLEIVMKKQPIHMDMIGSILNLDAGTLNSIVTILEIKEIIEQLPGKIIIVK
ncbi:DNA-processing protein DprA [Wukongibacter baidiensis]|uniref:DNA-processing protein DprA n=1 Tax=Wukongibacter baidiensis TaxID=1723361 RepID=UPI003D7F3F28